MGARLSRIEKWGNFLLTWGSATLGQCNTIFYVYLKIHIDISWLYISFFFPILLYDLIGTLKMFSSHFTILNSFKCYYFRS